MDRNKVVAPLSNTEYSEIFRLLVDGVRDYAIYMLDINGNVESWNAGAERAKQYTAQEIIGKHFSTFYTAEDRVNGKPQRMLDSALADGRVEDEGWRVRKDGTRFWADLIITAIYDDNGVHIGYGKVTRDMTERRMLMDTKEEAMRASTAKSAFLANMSHELRTPLTGIIGYAEMVQEHLTEIGMSDMASDVGKILYSANHLQSIVSDILDLSKIEAGQLELKREKVDLDQLIQEVVGSIQPLALCTQSTLTIHSMREGIELSIDRTRLKQVLYNLLSNAAKFTHAGTITVSANLDETTQPVYALISIADTGVGMSESEAGAVFERFYRSEIHVNQYNQGGTGLGLAICRMLCEAMGGGVTVKSKSGEGSTFTVRLPLTPDNQR